MNAKKLVYALVCSLVLVAAPSAANVDDLALYSCEDGSPVWVPDIRIAFGPLGTQTDTRSHWICLGEGNDVPDPGDTLVSPDVERRLDRTCGDEIIPNLAISMRSNVRVEPLPRFVPHTPQGEPGTGPNAARQEHMDAFRSARLDEQQPAKLLIEGTGGEIRYQSPLASTIFADVPCKTLSALIRKYRPAVVAQVDRLADPGGPMYGDGTERTILDAREQANALPLYGGGFTGAGYTVATLDSGITEHTVLQGRIASANDCTNGSADCAGPSTQDCGVTHGTAAAGIVGGNGNLGVQHHGVSDASIHSWKIILNDAGLGGCAGSPERLARGLENSVVHSPIHVINFGSGASTDAAYIATLEDVANDAYRLGGVVLSSAGNTAYTGSGSINAPGSAANVLAVGAIEDDGTRMTNSSLGPSPRHGLTKPNVAAPTSVIAASQVDAFTLEPFSGTSAAVPFAGGVAAMLLDVYDTAGGAAVPEDFTAGSTYAAMTAMGRRVPSIPGNINDEVGAGLMTLGRAECAEYHWGVASVGDGDSEARPVAFPATAKNVKIGAWWTGGEGDAYAGNREIHMTLTHNGLGYVSDHREAQFQRIWIPDASGPAGDAELTFHSPGGPSGNGDRIVYWFVYFETGICSEAVPSGD